MNVLIPSALWATAGLWSAGALLGAGEWRGGAAAPAFARASRLLALAGLVILAVLIAALWTNLGRAPLRTLGETRLWYALLLPAIALTLEWHLKTTALRLPMLVLGLVFVSINIARPDALDRTLMPALRSTWFVPHVVVYISAYACLGLAFAFSSATLLRHAVRRTTPAPGDVALPALLARIGVPFLTLGLLFGALWAKEAWGHYWTWDPKETWAFLTWGAYLGILHGATPARLSPRATLGLYTAAFAVVLGCWFLVNYLPAAHVSVHTYAMPPAGSP